MSDRRQEQGVVQSVGSGLRVSQLSFAWTIVAGACSIAIGVVGNSLVLIAFGVIGLLDAVGSGTLIVHFRHAKRHDAISERHERISLLVVTIGMAMVGLATIADSAFRLAEHVVSSAVPLGIALAGISVFVLGALAASKQAVARRIPSKALHADGWLSAMGAVLALVALIGTTLNAELGLWWIDSLAAIAVACGAVTLSVALARGPDLRLPEEDLQSLA